VRIPEFRLVHTVEEITEAARELGFPAIVKPTMGACSQGVTVLSDADALSGLDGLVTHDVFHEPITEWLVERYIRGREIAVNFFSADGDHRVVDMWEYGQPDSGDYDFPLWDILQIDETHPDWERVEEYVREALDAFGIQRGPSHTEVKCNADGVHLMETGARLSGGPAVELWAKYSDIRPFHDAIDSYLGRRPAIMDKPLGFQAVFGSVVIRNDDAPGTLVAVHGLEKLDGLPGVEEVAVGYRPGDRVPLTRDSVSIPFSASVSGPDKDAVLNTLHTIRSLVTLEIKPDPVPMATADGNTKP
jgi:biotin carboxylase